MKQNWIKTSLAALVFVILLGTVLLFQQNNTPATEATLPTLAPTQEVAQAQAEVALNTTVLPTAAPIEPTNKPTETATIPPTETSTTPPTETATQASSSTPAPTQTEVQAQAVEPTQSRVTLLQASSTPPIEPVSNVVVLRVETSQLGQLQADVAARGGTVEIVNAALGAVTVQMPNESAVQALAQAEYVQASEADYYVVSQALASDPRISEQWALSAMSIPLSLPDDLPTVKVAVIDSGICANNLELTGKILGGYDFIEGDTTPQDEMGHGCAVAGIIAANWNGQGMAGVAPNARLLAYRVLNAQGSGRYSSVASAIVRAVDEGAQIINLSLGGANPSQLLQDAVAYATSRNVLVIAAAGNSGSSSVLYPAAYAGVVSVGATNPDGTPASFSNRGKVELWAPGVDILSLSLIGDYALMSGTSFAAPNVAGLAALEMGQGRSLALGGSAGYGATQNDTITPTPDFGLPEWGLIDNSDQLRDEPYSPTELQPYFEQAEAEFGVPIILLQEIARAESGFNQRGGLPTTDMAYGLMGLRSSSSVQTLNEASDLLSVSVGQLKLDVVENIRGAAAVLRSYFDDEWGESAQFFMKDPASWVGSVKRYMGQVNDEVRLGYARLIYTNIQEEGYNVDFTGLGLAEESVLLPQNCTSSYLVNDVALASTSNYSSGRSNPISMIVIHIGEGSYWGGLSWFQNPASQVSAHYFVSRGGAVGLSVCENNTAWHAGNWDTNTRSIGIEHEGFYTQAYPDAQWQKTAALVRDITTRYNIPRNRTQIIGHYQVPGVTSRGNCPGPNWPWDAFMNQVIGVSAPGLMTPQNGTTITTRRPTFTWLSVNGAISYELSYGTTNPPTGTPIPVTGTSYTAVSDLPVGTIYWWMRSVGSSGTKSDWSWIPNFTISPSPAPANTNLVLNPDFTGGSFANWKKNEGQGQTYTMTTSGGRNVVAFTSPTDQNYGAVPHQDLMHSLPANAPIEITFWAGNTSSVPKQIRANIVRVENTSERIECIFTIPANFPLAQYTIRGRTTNAWAGIRLHFWNNTPDNLPALIMTGTNVQYKPTLSVAGTSCLEPTFPTPAAPVLTAPTVTVTNNNRPTVASNSVANVSSYIFEFSLNNFSTIAHSATVTTTSYTPPSGLPDGTYSIRVRGLNALNQAGANSAPKTLTIDTVPPAVPVLSAPAANASITALTPTFSWIAPLGATGYELRYGFSNPPAQTISNLTTTSTTLTQPLTIGTVFWQVRAQDAADNWSAWSSVSSFNLDSAANTAPRVVRQGTSVTLTWNPQDWALGYEVQVATNSTFTAIVYQTNSLPAGTWQTTTTLPAGTYYWRMRIKSGATTWSPWSPVETLIVR